jgi:hypothetical protein
MEGDFIVSGGQPMHEETLESLARRVEALERAVGLQPPADKNAWRRVVGMFTGSDVMRQVDEEGRKIREAERAQAQQEPAAE